MSEQMRKQLRSYLIIGSINSTLDPLFIVNEALRGGISMLQFREKGPNALRGDAKVALALSMQAACRRAGVPFIINDDVNLALLINADGVHIGQDDEPPHLVRSRIKGILGISTHTLEEARRAALQGADYIGVGPIYETSSKDDARPATGTELIKRMRDEGIALPLVGIGGITLKRATEVIHAGADGVAVISAIVNSDNIYEATRDINKRVLQAMSQRF